MHIFNIHVVCDISMFNIPFAMFFHMHIVMKHVVLTLNILPLMLQDPLWSLWKLNTEYPVHY